ncbi:MAG: hypothetical protein HC901_00140 [Bdellovibrionaceae bacterium]|nr:hypothetical protein [Pseudobdellovibrionaceae bacterium]
MATGAEGSLLWSVASGSSLPNGLSLNANTGELSGTPTDAGTYNFSIQVNDDVDVATVQFSLKVSSAPLILDATGDFPDLTSGAIPYYIDTTRDALAIDASNTNYRGPFARAVTTFSGWNDTYAVTIDTLGEEDGESTYRFYVNGALMGSVENTPTTEAYNPQTHILVPQVIIPSGATLWVESNADSNGLIPEGSGFAWSRGRWTTLTLTPVDDGVPETYVLAVNSGSGDGNYQAGTVVNISADAAPAGKAFAAWTGDVSTVADVTNATTTVTMPAGAVTLTATYVDVLTVNSFTLMDAITNLPVAGYDPIPSHAVINTNVIGTTNLYIRANTSPTKDFGSVVFDLTGATTKLVIESRPSWTISGSFNNGEHTLTATPYDANSGVGNAGHALTLQFTVTDAVRYEAEDAVLTGGTVADLAQASGGQFVDGSAGFKVSWNVTASAGTIN